jgi:hypothetical protein
MFVPPVRVKFSSENPIMGQKLKFSKGKIHLSFLGDPGRPDR